MSDMRDAIVVLLAGGQGERLWPLTRDRAKPAVPFGALYRIIDITLSNCINSRGRSEEHTSELQSRLHLVCRLLLEKKKQTRPPPRELRARAVPRVAARLCDHAVCLRRILLPHPPVRHSSAPSTGPPLCSRHSAYR